MHPILAEVTRDQLKKHVPDFRAGDSLRVAVRIVEGDKERTQRFEGVCIARHGVGMDETFTVRRVSYGVGIERIFPLHSPRVESITVLRHGHVRRAKLYYLRDLTGKKARLPETKRKRLAKGHLLEVALPALAAAKDPKEAVAAVAPEEAADEQTTEAAATEEPAQAKGADEAQAEAGATGPETVEKAAEDKPADAKPAE